MTQVKAKLTIVLKADDTVVAEREDPILWQRVLAAMNTAPAPVQSATVNGMSASPPSLNLGTATDPLAEPTNGEPLRKFAQAIGTPMEVILGACSPSTEAPFLHLDRHSWEEMKRQLPPCGAGSLNAIAMAATLLALWFKSADLGSPTQAQAQAVLGTIDISDHNPLRGLKAADWLQTRPGGIILLNPARNSRALSIARSFCNQTWTVDSSIDVRAKTASGIPVTTEPLL